MTFSNRAAAALLMLGYTRLSLADTGPVAFSISKEVVQYHPSQTRRNADVSLRNISSVAYTVSLTIGTPPQSVKVVLDTGSDELWVNPTCISGGQSADAQLCKSSGHYSPRSSSTGVQLPTQGNTIQYGKGSVSVVYYSDTVGVPEASMTLANVQFGVGISSRDLYLGILGMGYGRNAGYPTFVDAVAKQGVAGGQGRVFSVALGSAAHNDYPGTLVLGGLDRNRFTGRLAPVPILAPPSQLDPLLRYWVQLDSVGYTGHDSSTNKMKSTVYPNSGGPVVLDTGTSLSILPLDVVRAILQDMGVTATAHPGDGASSIGGSLYRVPCNLVGLGGQGQNSQTSMQTVDFSFNNGAAVVRVPVSEFAVQLDTDTCILGAMSMDDSPSSSSSSSSSSPETTRLLGASFLRGAYIVFDQSANSVFMAPYAVCNGGKSDLETLASAPPGQAGNITGACATGDSLTGGGGGEGGVSASANDSKKSGCLGGVRRSARGLTALVAVMFILTSI